MSYTKVTQVVSYRTAGSSVILNCATASDRTEESGRIIPVTLQFLQPGVFRLRMDANPEAGGSGDNEPAESPRLDVTEAGDSIHIMTAELRLSIGRSNWSFQVADSTGKVLVSERRSPVGPRGEAGVEPLGFGEEQINNGSYRVVHARTAFSLEQDERIFGLGEKSISLDKRGRTIDAWTTKAHGTETERAYKNVPFYLSTRGYGLLVDSSRRISFDFGSRTTAAMTLSIDGETLDIIIFHGPSFKKILELFTLVTGRSRIPPKWSFGLWMSRAMYMSRAEVEEVADRLRKEKIPCDEIHLDPAWMRDGPAFSTDWCSINPAVQ